MWVWMCAPYYWWDTSKTNAYYKMSKAVSLTSRFGKYLKYSALLHFTVVYFRSGSCRRVITTTSYGTGIRNNQYCIGDSEYCSFHRIPNKVNKCISLPEYISSGVCCRSSLLVYPWYTAHLLTPSPQQVPRSSRRLQFSWSLQSAGVALSKYTQTAFFLLSWGRLP